MINAKGLYIPHPMTPQQRAFASTPPYNAGSRGGTGLLFLRSGSSVKVDTKGDEDGNYGGRS